LYVHSIPPNPSTPSVESWYVLLGSHFLSITPVFPHLKLGVDIDHISPAVNGFKNDAQAAPIARANGLEIVVGDSPAVPGGAGWFRDPDGLIYQLSGATASVYPGPPFTQILVKAGERQGTPFVPVGIREIALRVADLNKSGNFLAKVFGGEVRSDSAEKSRRFKFGRTEIRLIPRAPGMPNDVSLDHWTITTKDFNADSAKRALQQRGSISRRRRCRSKR
jgi:hypothetical protein